MDFKQIRATFTGQNSKPSYGLPTQAKDQSDNPRGSVKALVQMYENRIRENSLEGERNSVRNSSVGRLSEDKISPYSTVPSKPEDLTRNRSQTSDTRQGSWLKPLKESESFSIKLNKIEPDPFLLPSNPPVLNPDSNKKLATKLNLKFDQLNLQRIEEKNEQLELTFNPQNNELDEKNNENQGDIEIDQGKSENLQDDEEKNNEKQEDNKIDQGKSENKYDDDEKNVEIIEKNEDLVGSLQDNDKRGRKRKKDRGCDDKESKIRPRDDAHLDLLELKPSGGLECNGKSQEVKEIIQEVENGRIKIEEFKSQDFVEEKEKIEESLEKVNEDKSDEERKIRKLERSKRREMRRIEKEKEKEKERLRLIEIERQEAEELEKLKEREKKSERKKEREKRKNLEELKLFEQGTEECKSVEDNIEVALISKHSKIEEIEVKNPDEEKIQIEEVKITYEKNENENNHEKLNDESYYILEHHVTEAINPEPIITIQNNESSDDVVFSKFNPKSSEVMEENLGNPEDDQIIFEDYIEPIVPLTPTSSSPQAIPSISKNNPDLFKIPASPDISDFHPSSAPALQVHSTPVLDLPSISSPLADLTSIPSLFSLTSPYSQANSNPLIDYSEPSSSTSQAVQSPLHAQVYNDFTYQKPAEPTPVVEVLPAKPVLASRPPLVYPKIKSPELHSVEQLVLEIDITCINCYECIRPEDIDSHSAKCIKPNLELNDSMQADIRLRKLLRSISARKVSSQGSKFNLYCLLEEYSLAILEKTMVLIT